MLQVIRLKKEEEITLKEYLKMRYQLINLEVESETENYIIFIIEVHIKSPWKAYTLCEFHKCFKDKKSNLNRSNFMRSGEGVFTKFLYLDESINAILDSPNLHKGLFLTLPVKN